MACMAVYPMVFCNVNNLKFFIPLLSYLFCYKCHCCYNLITKQIIDHIKSFKFSYCQIHSKEFQQNPQLDNNINITTQHFSQLGNQRNVNRLSINKCLIRITIQNSPRGNLTLNSHYEKMLQKRPSDPLNCNGCLAEMTPLHMKTDENGFQLHGTGDH